MAQLIMYGDFVAHSLGQVISLYDTFGERFNGYASSSDMSFKNGAESPLSNLSNNLIVLIVINSSKTTVCSYLNSAWIDKIS